MLNTWRLISPGRFGWETEGGKFRRIHRGDGTQLAVGVCLRCCLSQTAWVWGTRLIDSTTFSKKICQQHTFNKGKLKAMGGGVCYPWGTRVWGDGGDAPILWLRWSRLSMKKVFQDLPARWRDSTLSTDCCSLYIRFQVFTERLLFGTSQLSLILVWCFLVTIKENRGYLSTVNWLAWQLTY